MTTAAQLDRISQLKSLAANGDRAAERELTGLAQAAFARTFPAGTGRRAR